MFYDTHVHSRFSIDSEAPPEALCRAAQDLGLAGFCFTDHVDIVLPKDPSPVDLQAYRAEFTRIRAEFPDLRLTLGLEVGDHSAVRHAVQEILKGIELDFTLLSRHVVDGLDPYFPPYFEGRTRAQAIEAYLGGVLRSVQSFGHFDALAHIGYVMRTSPYPKAQQTVEFEDAPDLIDAILKCLVARGAALEINTSGYRYNAHGIPSLSVLRRFRELGGEWITLGSDTHRAETIAGDFALGRETALAAGFTRAAYFVRHEAVPYQL